MIEICYQDSATFIEVASSGYSGDKTVVERATVNCLLVQNTQFSHSSFQDAIEADYIMWVDPENTFVSGNYNRLEGMYVIVSPFGAGDSISWYKVTDVTVNRDHLLENEINNIELRLKKTEALPNVS